MPDHGATARANSLPGGALGAIPVVGSEQPPAVDTAVTADHRNLLFVGQEAMLAQSARIISRIAAQAAIQAIGLGHLDGPIVHRQPICGPTAVTAPKGPPSVK